MRPTETVTSKVIGLLPYLSVTIEEKTTVHYKRMTLNLQLT